MKVIDKSLKYPGLHRGQVGRCDLRVYQLGRGQELWNPRSTYVIVFSEPLDYDGLSVTNGCERIATAVWALPELREHDYARVLWVEHYPANYLGGGYPKKESFDLVTFDWERTANGPVARRPVWHRVNREWVEDLIKEAY